MDRQRGALVNSGLLPHRKQPEKAFVASDDKLLVGREEAAEMLSISCRALDYLIANKQLKTRRIGSRVLIPTSDLRRFSRADHPEKLAG
jgi:excisionase family DNA binding protein